MELEKVGLENWYYNNVLEPQIEKLPYRIKQGLVIKLLDSMEFKDMYEYIIDFNLRHRENIETLRQQKSKRVLDELLSQYPLTPDDCINKKVISEYILTKENQDDFDIKKGE